MHCVASQAVRLSGKPSLVIAEMPANGGLLRIGRRSPRSGISHFWPGTADSLRPIFEIFPFLGDRDRRPGSICTAWSLWQSSSGTSQLISHKIGVTQNAVLVGKCMKFGLAEPERQASAMPRRSVPRGTPALRRQSTVRPSRARKRHQAG